jgi:uncharacterized protein (UPF0332 family)
MSHYDYQSCIDKGLLRPVPASRENAGRSLKTAHRWLEEAMRGFEGGAFNSSVLASYTAMFHSARAVLFFDGFREKSHFCIARYLEEKYVKTKVVEASWVHLLDHYRELRHEDQYSMTFLTIKDEARKALDMAGAFIKRMETLLGSKGLSGGRA